MALPDSVRALILLDSVKTLLGFQAREQSNVALRDMADAIQDAMDLVERLLSDKDTKIWDNLPAHALGLLEESDEE